MEKDLFGIKIKITLAIAEIPININTNEFGKKKPNNFAQKVGEGIFQMGIVFVIDEKKKK